MMKKKNKSAVTLGEKSISAEQWDMFVKVVAAHVDPVLASMLYATQFVQFDAAQKVVRVATLKKFALFQDLFIEQKKVYQEYLDRIFGFQAMLLVEFTQVAEPKIVVVKNHDSQNRDSANPDSAKHDSKKVEFKVTDAKKSEQTRAQGFKQPVGSNSVGRNPVGRNVDVSDTQKWKVTHALLEHFGGSVREIVKDTDEFDA